MFFLQTNNSLTTIKNFINGMLNHRIERTAKSIGFIKRNDGKLLPATFVKALTLGLLNTSNPTLQLISDTCEDMQEGLHISREAIYQRLGAGATLLKEVFKQAMECAANHAVEACKTSLSEVFKNIYICDSTCISLPEKLAKTFYGSGGTSKKGGLHIQTVYSLVNRCIKSMDVVPGHVNDTRYTREIATKLNPGDLVMFDKGYKNKLGYKDIIEKNAFFLTRASKNTMFYGLTSKGYAKKCLDIVSILKNSNGIVDMEVQVGGDPERRIRCRFLAIRLPDAIANERVRKARINCRKKKQFSEKELEMLRWETFITNVPAEKLSTESACELYRLRWQIEILFKACKSNLGLERIGVGGKHQVECILYGKLIIAVLTTLVYSRYYEVIYRTFSREVSILKFSRYLRERLSGLIYRAGECLSLYKSIIELVNKVALKSLYEKRARKSSLDKLISILPPIEQNTG